MDANGWAVVIAAIFLGLQQLLQMVLSFLRDRNKMVKLKDIGSHLDTNTAMTKAGAVAATETKKSVKDVADNIGKTLNGELDDRIKAIVTDHMAPIRVDIREMQKTLAEINGRMAGGI